MIVHINGMPAELPYHHDPVSDEFGACFTDGMSAYLHQLSLGGTADEETGSTDFGVWAARFGKRLLLIDEQGFVHQVRYPNAVVAEALFAGIAEDYAAWLAEDEAVGLA